MLIMTKWVFGCIVCIADAISALLRCPQVSFTLSMHSSLGFYVLLLLRAVSVTLFQEIYKSYLNHFPYIHRESEVPVGVISPMGTLSHWLTGGLFWAYKRPALYNEVYNLHSKVALQDQSESSAFYGFSVSSSFAIHKALWKDPPKKNQNKPKQKKTKTREKEIMEKE